MISTTHQLTYSLGNLGPSAQMFKIDISRAFRQIKVDPGDIDLEYKISGQILP